MKPICIFLLLFFPTSSHVVFEEIGTMAGSTSYIHITVRIGLQEIEDKVMEYSEAVLGYKTQIIRVFDDAARSFEKQHPKTPYHDHRDKYLDLVNLFTNDAGKLKSRIVSLRGSLPTPHRDARADRESRDLKDALSNVGRKVVKTAAGGLGTSMIKVASKGILRSIFSSNILFSLGQGILGTFMGLYTQSQIRKLRHEVSEIREDQERIVEAVTENRASINNLEVWHSQLNSTIQIFNKLNAAAVMTLFRSMHDSIQHALEVAVHTVQQAQHHRLAIDLLSSGKLFDLFEDLQSLASNYGFKLLTTLPSDLFQVETSYIYDGTDLILILHVPMVPANSLLRLFRLRPFPIPFSKTHALLPRPSTSLLALSQGSTRLMTSIEHSDLMDCHQINNVYVCERHGVLFKNIKSTCLGALFEQDIPVARLLCDLEVVPYKEAILQLQSNWFLVYSPTMHTAYVECQNGSSSEVHVRKGVNKIFIDPSCHLDLKDHRLMSEFSLQLDSSVKYFQWESEDMSLFDLQEIDIEEAVSEAGSREQGVLLADVVKTRKGKFRFPSWKTSFGIIGGLLFLGLLVAIGFGFGAQRISAFRTRFRNLKNLITSLLPNLTDQINRILRHLHLPQLRLANLYPNLEMLENNLAVAVAPPHPPPPPVHPFNPDPLLPSAEEDK